MRRNFRWALVEGGTRKARSRQPSGSSPSYAARQCGGMPVAAVLPREPSYSRATGEEGPNGYCNQVEAF